MAGQTVAFVLRTALAASVTLNVGLGYSYYRTHKPAPQALAVGATAPVIKAHDLKGRAITHRFGEKAAVLYVVAPGCGWCARNTSNIRELWSRRRNDYLFIGLSLKGEGLVEYLARNPLPFPVYVPEVSTVSEYGLGVTPSTIVMDDHGKVVKKWNGAYANALPRIESFFGVKLPGIEPERESR